MMEIRNVLRNVGRIFKKTKKKFERITANLREITDTREIFEKI